MSLNPEDTFIPVHVTLGELQGQEIRVNTGSLPGEDPDTVPGYEKSAGSVLWGNGDGFISMPNPPNEDGSGACFGLLHHTGNEKWIVATKDNRFISRYGELASGDRAIVTDSPVAIMMKKATDSVSIFTENGEGVPMIFDVSGEEGTITSMVSGPDGDVSIIQQDAKEIRMSAGGSTLVINEAGLTVSGQTFVCATSGGHLGLLGPAPVPPGPANGIGVSSTPGTISTTWFVGL